MSSPLRNIVRFSIKPGRIDAFREAAEACTDTVDDTEPDVLEYSWHIDDDTEICWINELYASSEAFLAHMKGPVGTELLPRVLNNAELTTWILFGDPNEAIVKLAPRLGITILGAPELEISRPG